MEPIRFDGSIWPVRDISGNIRWGGKVNGKNMSRARLNMQNFLHTAHLPSWLYVHHGEAGTECDEIYNLFPTTNELHGKIHHPTIYASRYECEKVRRLKPEVRKSICDSSLKWYHKNKDTVNNNPEKKEYKKSWYLKNKDKILKKMKNRYDTDGEYRNNCIQKAAKQKQIIRKLREVHANEIS